MAKSKSEKRGVYLYIDGQEIINNVNHIEKECRQLTQQLNSMTIGSEEYNRQMQKIQHLKGILREHRNEIRGVTEDTKKSTISVGKLVDGFNRFGGIIVTVIGFLTGVTLALRSFRDERNKLEESQAGLKALTGLDDDSIAWLTRQAKQLSTTMTKEGLRVRQSASEILDAYMLVGSAKPELLGNKEALAAVTEEAMRLQAAAKDIKLSEAVDALTLSLNQYGAAADQAGRFANVLAAGSKEGAANIASQARTIRNAGVAAASANVSIEQTVGLIETLAEKGIKDEVAGTGLKKFFLVLQTGADDVNPKIVGLNQALDNLAAKNMGAKAIKDMFGEEGYNVASVIMQNIDKVKQYTAAVTDTNIAYEQAAINSNTAAAALDQARNKMKLAAIELGEKLNPAFTVSTNLATNLIKILPGLIDWFKKWGVVILALSAPVAAYVAYLKLAVLYHTVLNAVTKQATIIKTAYKAAIIALNYALAGDYKSITRLVLSMRSANVVTKLVTASTLILRGAVEALTFRFSAASKAISTSWAVMKMLPAGVIVAGVAAVTAAVVLLVKHLSEASEKQRLLNKLDREANEAIDEQRVRLETLWRIASDHTISLNKRKEAMDKINKISPQYLGDLTLETINTEKAIKAKDEYIKRLKQEAMLKGAQSYIEEESRKLIELQRKLNEALSGQKEARQGATYAQTGATAYDGVIVMLEEQIADSKKMIESYMNVYKQVADMDTSNMKEPKRTIDMVTKELENAQKVYTKLKNMNTESFSEGEMISFNAQYKKAAFSVEKLKAELDKLKKESQEAGDDTSGDGNTSDENKFAAAEAAYYQKVTSLKKQYLQDGKMTQEEYLNFMTDLELKYLNEKLQIAGVEPKKREEINNQILDLRIKLKEQCVKEDLDEKKQILTNHQKELNAEIQNELELLHTRQISREDFLKNLAGLQKKYKSMVISETEDMSEEEKQIIINYLESISNEFDKAYSKMGQTVKDWSDVIRENWSDISKWTEISKEQQQAILSTLLIDILKFTDNSLESLDSVKDKYEAIFTLMSGIASDFGTALGETLTDSEDAMGEYLKNLVIMVLDTIQKLLVAYISMTTMRNVSELGLIGLAKAAAEIALITAAFETAKGAIGNFYTGGFTPSGDWDQPQGLVHSNEFVANRFAVANPHLRPIFDVIDVAQRSGNVANLTADDIAAVASGSRASAAPSAPMSFRDGNTATVNDPALAAMLAECTRTLRRLKQRLDEPITAETYLTGKGGINEAQKEYTKIQNNKSRHRNHD